MHQNSPYWEPESKNFSGKEAQPPPQPLPHPTPSAPSAPRSSRLRHSTPHLCSCKLTLKKSLPCSSSAACTALLLHTWRMSYVVWLTATPEGGCVEHPRLRWWFRQPAEWQSATVPFLLQGHVTCLERASIFCHWIGYCSHLQASLEDVGYLFARSLSWYRDLVRGYVFKLPHNH